MSRPLFRALATVGAVLAFVVTMAVAPPAHAGCQTPPDPTMTPTEGPAGTVVTFELEAVQNSCVPRPDAYQEVYFIVGDAPDLMPNQGLVQSMVQPDGGASAQYTIPGDAPAGDIDFFVTVFVAGTPVNGTALSTSSHGFSRAGLNGVYQSWGPYTFTVTEDPAEPTISVSKTDLLPGDTFDVMATGFEPGTDVEIYLESDPVLLATAAANAQGAIATAVQVPADFPAGPHRVAAIGTGLGGGALRLSTGVTVGSLAGAAATTTVPGAPAATPTQTGTSTLPLTGTESTLALVGVALLVAGGLAVVAARRREA